MPTPLDLQLAPVVVQLIQTFGKDVTFTIGGDFDFDYVTGHTDRDGETKVTLKASPPAPVRRQYAENDDEEDRRSECRVYVAATGLGFTPKLGMVVEIDGQAWRTTAVYPVYTGENIAAYGVDLRKEGS